MPYLANSFDVLEGKGRRDTVESIARSKSKLKPKLTPPSLPTAGGRGAKVSQPPRPAAVAAPAPAPPSGPGRAGLGRVVGGEAKAGNGVAHGDRSGGRGLSGGTHTAAAGSQKDRRLSGLHASFRKKGAQTLAMRSSVVLEDVNWDCEAIDLCYPGEQSTLKGYHTGLERVIGTNQLTEVVVKRYPKKQHADRYFSFLQKSTHSSLLRVRGLYQTVDYDIISFEPVHTTLQSYLASRSHLLLTEDREGFAVDFTKLMIGHISNAASGLEEVHHLGRWYGDLHPEEVLIQLDESYPEDDFRHATIKLPVPLQEDPDVFSDKKLEKEQATDFCRLGHLIGSLCDQNERMRKQDHILAFKNRLTGSKIKSLREVNLDSAMWSPANQAIVLLASDMLINDHFSVVKFPQKDWHDVLSKLVKFIPKDPPKSPNDSSTLKTTNRHIKKKKKNRAAKYYKLGRNVVAHFEDPYDSQKEEFYELVGSDVGSAIRYLRGYYPQMFPELVKDCEKHMPKRWKTVEVTISG